MKALLTTLALLSFIAASTLPMVASAQETKGDQTKGDQMKGDEMKGDQMKSPDTGMSSEKGATAPAAKRSHKATTHRTRRRASGRRGHHGTTSKKTKAPETAPPKEG